VRIEHNLQRRIAIFPCQHEGVAGRSTQNGHAMYKHLIVGLIAAIAALLALIPAGTASAASCSTWRATCVKRATSFNTNWLPQCDAKFNECLSNGCFTEGAHFGGANHCGLSRK
jgi:hypothetical protein